MRKGNDRFQGFAVDLIHEVAKMLGFQYEIHLVADGNFGSKQEDGEWNGMIGELLAGVSPGEVLGNAVQCNTTGYNNKMQWDTVRVIIKHCSRMRGYLFASDSKMYTRIFLGDIPFIPNVSYFKTIR